MEWSVSVNVCRMEKTAIGIDNNDNLNIVGHGFPLYTDINAISTTHAYKVITCGGLGYCNEQRSGCVRFLLLWSVLLQWGTVHIAYEEFVCSFWVSHVILCKLQVIVYITNKCMSFKENLSGFFPWDLPVVKISPEWVTGPEQGKSSCRIATFSLWTGVFRNGISQGNETLFPNWQKEPWQTFEETSGYVRPERVNKWPTPWQIYDDDDDDKCMSGPLDISFKAIMLVIFFTVVPCTLILSMFYYQLMHKRISLKGILKFTLKQLQHVLV